MGIATGATEPALPLALAADAATAATYEDGAAAGSAATMTGLDRRTNAGGGDDSRTPGASL
jgi:hypothetical protein